MSQNIQTAALQLNDKTIRIFDGLYCLNDLHKASGGEDRFTPNRFMRLDQTKDLIMEIKLTPDMALAYKTIKGGQNPGTYACRELVYAYAMWISAAFHLAVIRFFDQSQKLQQPVAVAKQVYIPDNIGRFLVTNSANGTTMIRDASHCHIVSVERMNKITNHIHYLSQQLELQSQQLAYLAAAVTSNNEILPVVEFKGDDNGSIF